MQNIFYLLIRFSGFFMFLFLEVLCVYLIVQYNKKQKDLYLTSANAISGAAYARYDKFNQYIHLGENAAKLAQENARLMEALPTAKLDQALVRDSVVQRDSMKHVLQRYAFITAEVINNSISLPNNYLTLNKGSKQGIVKGMGVITTDGVVGIVRAVSDNFSSVISVFHQQSKISAAIHRKGHFGSLVWNERRNPFYLYLEDIPKHAEIAKGDTVETSGYSAVFPKGVMIGVVDTFKIKDGGNFYTIDVRLKANLGRIKYVYVVNNLFKAEQDAVEKTGNE
jgi:rod shape-determining protein MreC